jgi:microsomal prostaglandin-E synthase 2
MAKQTSQNSDEPEIIGGVQQKKAPEAVVEGNPTLYCFETCPFCWKVRSLLKLRGINYSKVEVDPMKKKELAFSDWKAVPVFVDADGTQVYDSNDILHYINENLSDDAESQFPTPFPTPGQDAAQDEWMDFSNDHLGKSIVPVIYRSYRSSLAALDYVTKVENFGSWQAFKAKWIGAIVMRLVARSRSKSFDVSPEENLQQKLNSLAGGISSDFFGGKSPNGADHANYGILRAMQGLRGFDIVQSHDSIWPWYQRMQSVCGE